MVAIFMQNRIKEGNENSTTKQRKHALPIDRSCAKKLHC